MAVWVFPESPNSIKSEPSLLQKWNANELFAKAQGTYQIEPMAVIARVYRPQRKVVGRGPTELHEISRVDPGSVLRTALSWQKGWEVPLNSSTFEEFVR